MTKRAIAIAGIPVDETIAPSEPDLLAALTDEKRELILQERARRASGLYAPLTHAAIVTPIVVQPSVITDTERRDAAAQLIERWLSEDTASSSSGRGRWRGGTLV